MNQTRSSLAENLVSGQGSTDIGVIIPICSLMINDVSRQANN